MGSEMVVANTTTFVPSYAVPPGETLDETIQALGISRAELARRIDLSAETVVLIVRGAEAIGSETARGLERVTGVPAYMWNVLESCYREELGRR